MLVPPLVSSQDAEKVCQRRSPASLRGSEALEGIFRSPRSILRANGHTKCGWYLLASSLAAALLDSLFEHPAGDPALSTYLLPVGLAAHKLSFSASC